MEQYSDDRRDDRQLDRIYTRLRLGTNGLHFTNQTHNEMDPLCPHCDDPVEDTDHYFFKCPMHMDHRTTMLNTIKDSLPDIGNITISTLLNPSPAQSKTVRKAVFQFVRDTDYLSLI